MTFRRTVFWSIAATIGIMVALEAVLDIVVERAVANHAERMALGLVSSDAWTTRLYGNPLMLDLIDLPVFVAVAFATAWWLSRRLARPINSLTQATEQLASEHFPEPLTVPDGDDELARLARSFNRMSAALRAMLERERTFTRYATHELRTPLAALKLQIERGQRGAIDGDPTLDAIARNVLRIEEVLEALLAIGRGSDRDRVARPLGTIVEETLAAFPATSRARIELVSLPPDVRVTDGALVQRALHNLVDNALKHGGRPTHVHVHRRDEDLTLRVRDGGPGVPESALAQLPEPYVRGEHRGGGHGLGLSLVAVIADALDGELDLRNLAPGFEATLRLPVVVDGTVGSKPSSR
jgi:signal transduction histidine kinase